jgi:ribosomal protein S18 acetylase RimI-like enzyme
MMIKVRGMEILDREEIEQILAEVKVFPPKEIEVALEVIDTCLSGSSDYIIKVVANEKDIVLGYICYGKVPLTDAVWDIYWIVVREEFQGKGIASRLMEFAEGDLKANNARAIMVETSSIPEYKPARDFYARKGFNEVCRIEDFYAEGNDKVIYRKNLVNPYLSPKN